MFNRIPHHGAPLLNCLVALALGTILTACGGGGGDGSSASTTTTSTPPPAASGPRQVASLSVQAVYATVGSPRSLLKDGNTIYLADNTATLKLLGLSDDLSIVEVSTLDLGTDVKTYGLAKSGNFLYVAGREGGLTVVDVSDPANPMMVSNSQTADIAMYPTIAGDMLYLSDRKGLIGFDISDPAQPFQVWRLSADKLSFLRSTVQGEQLVIAGYTNGLEVYSSPASAPVLASSFSVGRPAWSIAAHNTADGVYYLVAGESAGLTVYDPRSGSRATPTLPLTNVANPTKEDETGYGIAIQDQFAFIANGKNGVRAVGLETISSPYMAGGLNTRGDVRDIVVENDLMIIADAVQGVLVVNIEILPDSDGDGFANGIDDFPSDAAEWRDTDNDGVGNNADTDDDNDGIADADDPHSGLFFQWELEPITNGYFDIRARWQDNANSPRKGVAVYTIDHGRGQDTVQVDQTTVQGEWVYLGRYFLHQGRNPRVTLASEDSLQADEGEVTIEFDGEIRPGWAIQNISNTPIGSETGQCIEGNKIVWVRNAANIQMFDIETFELETISVTGKEAGLKFAPNIQSGNVVWRLYDRDRIQSIYMWDGSEINLIDSYMNEGMPFIVDQFAGFPPSNHALDPSTFEGRVVYSKWDGSDYELFVWEDGDITQITDDDDNINDLEPNIWGDYIAFSQWPFDKVDPHYASLWDGSKIIQLAERGDDPHTDGESVVFSDWNDDIFGRGFDVILWKDGVYTNISPSFGNDFEPQVSGNLISWANNPREGFTESTSRDVYIYDNGEIEVLADSDLNEHITWTDGDIVVFGRSDGSQYDVYLATRIPEDQ